MKKILFLGLILFVVTACDSDEEKKSSCQMSECIESIEIGDDISVVEEITEIKGVEEDDSLIYEFDENNKYIVNVDSENKITDISYEYDVEKYKQENNKFDDVISLIEKVNSAETVTYADLVSSVGKQEGIMVYKSSFETKYLWVDNNLGFIVGIFNTEGNLVGIDGQF